MFLENTLKTSQHGEGWIEVICGSMFSGKTEELIRRLNRARIAQQSLLLFKPTIDRRYAEQKVVSHNQKTFESISVASSAEIISHCTNVNVVAIDEGQFFDSNLPDVCNDLANRGIRVIVAGLDMDFQGKPFGSMPALMAIAEYVTKVHAICAKSGRLAHFSHRISGGSKQIEIGELDKYEPLSRKSFLKANSHGKQNPYGIA